MTITTRPWLVLSTLCFASSVGLMDATVVNVAIPSISHDLGATLDQVLWVINGYFLVTAVLLVTAGRLGDLYRPKTVFLTGQALFVLASAACGLAQTPTQLVVARVVQGIGAALSAPQSMSMITRIFPPEQRGRAWGIWGAFAGIAVAVGPTLGGLVAGSLGWRWVFFINVPVGVIGFVLAAIVVPNVGGHVKRRLDLVGAALLTCGLFLIVYGLLEGEPNQWGRVWGPVTVPMLLAGGALALLALFRVERGRQDREPLLPFVILRDRNFTLMSFVTATLACGVVSMLFLTAVYLQSGVGMSAFSAGLTVAIAPAVSVFVSPVSGRLTDRFGGKYVLVVGLILLAAGIGYLAAAARVDSTWVDLVPGMVIIGLGMGVTFAPPGTLAMDTIDPSLSGAASGVFSTTRLSGSVLGSATVGALIQVRFASSLADAAKATAGSLPSSLGSQFLASFGNRAHVGLDAGQVEALLPKGLSEQDTSVLRQAAESIVHDSLTDAVRFTYLFPVLTLVVGALVTMAIKSRSAVPEVPAEATR